MTIRVGDRFRYDIFIVTVIDLQFSYNLASGASYTYVKFDLGNIGSNGTLEGHVVLDMIANGELVRAGTPRDLLSHCVNCGASDTEDDVWIQVLNTMNVYEYPRITFTKDGGVDEFDIRVDQDEDSLEVQEIRCGSCLGELTDEQRKAYEEMVS
jgi:hypothetical protein